MARRRKRARAGFDAVAIAWYAPRVIAMRMLKLSQGCAAAAKEAEQVMAEKIEASWKIGLAAAEGVVSGRPEKAMREAARLLVGPVRANDKRLLAQMTAGRRKSP